MNQPHVKRIQVEYEDGSFDDISLSHLGVCSLFNLKRKRPHSDLCDLGAHTSGAIAAILFRTAALTERTEYPFNDPKLIAVLRQYFEPMPNKIAPEGNQQK